MSAPQNELYLRIIKDIFEVSECLNVKTFIWGGFVADITEGKFIREHHDLDGFILNMETVLDELTAQFENREYTVKFNTKFNILSIHKDELHAAFNILEIDKGVAKWQHIGKNGSVYFPSKWLDQEPVNFEGIKTYTAGIKFEYAFRTIAPLTNPEWKKRRPKDIQALQYYEEKLRKTGVTPEELLDKIWCYNPFWIDFGYSPFKPPVLVTPGQSSITQSYECIVENIRKTVLEKYNELQPMTSSKVVVKISRTIMKLMPSDDDTFIRVCDTLMKQKEWVFFQLVTQLIKDRKTLYTLQNFDIYEKWLMDYVPSRGWGSCDLLCYRVLNPMVDRFPVLYDELLNWSKHTEVYVRRASAVALIKSSDVELRVNAPFDFIETICNIHIEDTHLHIQKAIGWLLKYAYFKYPNEVETYLRDNINLLSRTTFRYALSKMPEDKRQELMGI